jgi:protein-S-isoprenylcysteine O-methyltransferase Ste14
MNDSKLSGPEREAPYTHLVLILTPILFVLIWVLDSFVFHWTTFLNRFVPSLIQIPIFAVILLLGLFLIFISHKTLFHDEEPPKGLLTSGIFQYSRNPMYLGILFLYLSMIILSISLISIVLFIIIALIYNEMIKFEEKILEDLFGEAYKEYKQKVGRWIPKIA